MLKATKTVVASKSYHRASCCTQWRSRVPLKISNVLVRGIGRTHPRLNVSHPHQPKAFFTPPCDRLLADPVDYSCHVTPAIGANSALRKTEVILYVNIKRAISATNRDCKLDCSSGAIRHGSKVVTAIDSNVPPSAVVYPISIPLGGSSDPFF